MNTIKYMYTLYSLLLLLASCSDEDTTGYTVPEQIPATLTIQPDIEYPESAGFWSDGNILAANCTDRGGDEYLVWYGS